MNRGIILDTSGHITRREFVTTSVTGLKTIALGTFTVALINACSSENSNPVSSTGSGSITVDITASANSALQNIGGTVALGSNKVDSKGVFVIRVSESEVTAYSRNCTHQGCTVSAFQGAKAKCGCHGSEFNKSGQAVTGPATRSLTKYTATLEGNIITISV